MAGGRATRKSTKVFYLVPQKALAEEKYEELRGRYEEIGIKVVVPPPPNLHALSA